MGSSSLFNFFNSVEITLNNVEVFSKIHLDFISLSSSCEQLMAFADDSGVLFYKLNFIIKLSSPSFLFQVVPQLWYMQQNSCFNFNIFMFIMHGHMYCMDTLPPELSSPSYCINSKTISWNHEAYLISFYIIYVRKCRL